MSVFVSYKSEDRGAVQDIVTGLRQENIDVWWDQDIAPTADWRAEVARRLQGARVVVVVWSRNSADLEGGKWVIQEAEEADARGALVPVLIDDILPPLGMRHRQAADLVDWRGDRRDARWRGFVETVQAVLEGRAVDARVARDTGPQTAGAMLRGRSAQVILALGLAVLVVTSAIAFGPFVAASLVGGLALSYVALNILFSRRRRDRAAATFLHRAFAIGWVTTLANIVVWLAAAGAGAYPYARSALYEDLSVAVYDELRRPVPAAQVTVAFGEGRPMRVALNADGVGRVEYPLFWGPREAAVKVSHKDYESERSIRRDGDRFDDQKLGLPSGVERFRVQHLTLDELAIDAFQLGRTPQEIAEVVPDIVGVVRNPVWKETEAYLELFHTLSELGGTYYGASAERENAKSAGENDTETPAPSMPLKGDPGAEDRRKNLRWPRELSVSIPMDFSQGVLGCPIDRPLDRDYRLILGDSDNNYLQARLEPSGEATDALKPQGLDRVRDKDGRVGGYVVRLADHEWLGKLLDLINKRNLTSKERSDCLQFMVKRSVPPGVVQAAIRLATVEYCAPLSPGVKLTLPPARLRVSIIENVSDRPMPITAVVQGMAERDRIETWVQGRVDANIETPWPGGMLAPHKAIAVPRRLIIEQALTEEEVAAWRAGAEGPLLSFRVAARSEPYNGSAPGIVLHAGQVFVGAPSHEHEELHASTPYVIGPSVETLALSVNDVKYELREDVGIALAMIGGIEFGSCPLVYAASHGSDVFLNRGPIITNRVGPDAEGADRLFVGRTVGGIEIRELEYEISKLNRVRLIVQGGDGRERIYPAAQPGLRWKDSRYVALRQGETLVLEFPGYRPREQDRAVFLEAVGFYTPLPAPYRDHMALRRTGVPH
jgi:hypothetical protein